jgi:TRAP transporter TAXI family solute receptor
VSAANLCHKWEECLKVKKILMFSVVIFCLVFSPVHGEAAIAVRAAAGGVGGGWYTILAGLAEVVAAENPDINVQVIPGAGLSNIPRTGEKGVEIAFAYPPFTKACFNGTNPYQDQKPYDNIRAIGKGFGSNYFQFIVDTNTGISSIEEFVKSKKPIKISVDRVGTTDEWIFSKVLEFYGIDYKTIESWGGKVTHAGYGDQAVLIKDRQVDAMVANIAVPWTAAMEASIGRDMKLIPISAECQEYLREKYALIPADIPAGGYSFQPEPVASVATITQLITHIDMDEDLIYKITKTIFSNVEKVREIHDSLKDFDPSQATADNGAPLHPGAEKAFKEMGLL